MIRLPPRSTRTDTLFPDTTLFLSKNSGSGSRDIPPACRAALLAAQDSTRLRVCGPSHKPGEDQSHAAASRLARADGAERSEEQTSEHQSLMRNSYAVFCLKKKNI